MIRAAQERAARKRYRQIAAVLNEQGRRRFVASEAQRLERGGVSVMARITGLARSTIYHGLSDIRNNVTPRPDVSVRKVRGGRRRRSKIQPS
jgi:DNA-binding phage protein